MFMKRANQEAKQKCQQVLVRAEIYEEPLH